MPLARLMLASYPGPDLPQDVGRGVHTARMREMFKYASTRVGPVPEPFFYLV